LFVDLGATASSTSDQVQGGFIGAEREGSRIAIEIKEFRGQSAVVDLEQALGQYVLYQLLLNQVDPERELYLAITPLVAPLVYTYPPDAPDVDNEAQLLPSLSTHPMPK